MVLQLDDPDAHEGDKARIDAAQIIHDHVMQLRRHFHPRGAAAHYHKRQQPLPLLRARFYVFYVMRVLYSAVARTMLQKSAMLLV